MFAFRNFTGFAFVGKIGKAGIEFTVGITVGIAEEVAFNITGLDAAHATQIPQNINVKFISKDKFITGTSALVSSKSVQTKLFDVIAGATPNLLI